MCAVSAVSDYYTVTWPRRNANGPGTWGGHVPSEMDEETRRLLREVVQRLDKIDKRLGDVECKDASKTAFLHSIGLKPEDLA